jgi:flagellar biosynthesis protein FlhG
VIRQAAEKTKPCKTISVTSGKGGVGKTLTTIGLATAARRLGHSVLILDGDFGLANVDVVLGLNARYNIKDVIDGNAELKDIIVQGPLGIDLIPSGSGISSLTQLSYAQRQALLSQLDKFNIHYDFVIIDTGAGISENVLHFNAISDSIVVVTTPEPHAITDAYAIIKVLAEEHGIKCFNLLVNQTKSPDQGLKVFQRIAEVAERFLDIKVNSLGYVPSDPQISRQVMLRKTATESSTFTVAGQAWASAFRQLSGSVVKADGNTSDAFWKQVFREESNLPPRFMARV